jgi:hypothetical protein
MSPACDVHGLLQNFHFGTSTVTSTKIKTWMERFQLGPKAGPQPP